MLLFSRKVKKLKAVVLWEGAKESHNCAVWWWVLCPPSLPESEEAASTHSSFSPLATYFSRKAPFSSVYKLLLALGS